MFILDGKPLSPDRAFTHNGIQYPANWLRLSTLAEKEAIGITEVPDPPTYDERFYWGYDQDGQLIPKDHTQLVDHGPHHCCSHRHHHCCIKNVADSQ
jgi:hypothetical protein